MPEHRLQKARASLPPGYQFGDARLFLPEVGTALAHRLLDIQRDGILCHWDTIRLNAEFIAPRIKMRYD